MMIAGRRGNVDSIDILVKDQLIGVIVPLFHSMSLGKVLSRCPVATHHSDERAARRQLKSGPALHLRHGAATNDSPTYLLHFTRVLPSTPICRSQYIVVDAHVAI